MDNIRFFKHSSIAGLGNSSLTFVLANVFFLCSARARGKFGSHLLFFFVPSLDLVHQALDWTFTPEKRICAKGSIIHSRRLLLAKLHSLSKTFLRHVFPDFPLPLNLGTI